jgi:uracil-DNA glycosylase
VYQQDQMANRSDTARELLDFYAEAGVDALVGETPVDRLGATRRGETAVVDAIPVSAPQHEFSQHRSPQSEAPLPTVTSPSPTGATPGAPDIAVMAARAAARSAATLDELRGMLANFEGCALRTTAKQLVFADGNPQARVMFVGEAPGREEDLEGLPFVGRSGKLLDLMMAAIGLDRTGAYIANIIPWRPPGNRTPTPQESQICLPFIQRQIELANPDILVCLGGPASQTLLGVKEGIKRTRGRWFNFHTGTREIKAIATFHPAYLLRSPLEKRFAWRDFLAIKKALTEA